MNQPQRSTFRETVIGGAKHPGTELTVMSSAAGHYIGFRDEDGLPYSRETDYFPNEEDAHRAYIELTKVMYETPENTVLLPYVRNK